MSRVVTRTKASVSLAKWADTEGNSQGLLARALSISQPSVSQWVRGVSRPESHLREAIELITGIPTADWETKDERALVERVRADVEAERAPASPPQDEPQRGKTARKATAPQPAATTRPATRKVAPPKRAALDRRTTVDTARTGT